MLRNKFDAKRLRQMRRQAQRILLNNVKNSDIINDVVDAIEEYDGVCEGSNQEDNGFISSAGDPPLED